MKIQGIDVSKHNGTVDWSKVKSAGKDFAFIRLGWAGFDGKIQANNGLDTMFHANIKAAIAAGINVGIYVYSYCKTTEAAKIAAQETLELVKPYRLTYPIAFDIESTSTAEPAGTPYDKMTKTQNSAICAAFLSEIEKAGYYGLLYTYKSFAESYLDMSLLKAYDMWIAQYADACTYKGNYGIWQYAGDKGRCDGVNGACDLNVAYKDYAAIIKAAGLNRPKVDESAEDVIARLKEQNVALQNRIDTYKEAIAKIESIVKEIGGAK